ncbi:hypothetical protein [Hymenobacter psychrophilus]|uniref:Tetratricopeptide repeat-containing protein n=1 Tax=Hymenobacter psychrophilus TaxID=651662 RepID=A0A1H3J102_9BACT|nr:hypothetical protein [Hymenobacter psychrophilus]SDY33693.1 hypothetical protein SAMN04488069_107243 [Hymenobacter psychrophilus]
MKKPLLILALVAASCAALAQKPATAPVVATTTAVAAPTDPYTTMMTAAIAELMNTGDPAALKASAAKMERAASAKPQDWLPRYYQAYALLINVFQSKEDGDAKDKTLDQAEAALAQARRLGGADESELLVLRAYIHQARLGISPMLRSMKYSGMVNEAVEQAIKLNPANPRAYLVQANNVYFTPAMFGGGADKAKPIYEQAKARYAAFRPASSLAPGWGENQVNGRLKKYDTAIVK